MLKLSVHGRSETQPIRSHLAERFLTSSRLPQGTTSAEADGEVDEHPEFSLLASKPKETFQKIYTLSIHENAASQDVLLNQNMFPASIIRPGSLMRILPGTVIQLSLDAQDADRAAQANKFDANNAHLFFAKFASPEFLSRSPNIQISVPQSVATMLQVSKSSPILVSTVDEQDARASHVELIFRDQYLARADMWRLINDQLVGRCIHCGQKVEFMGTIKAVVKKIFVDGNKANTALFHHSTKPVFRSESARYVLFIQMSKEMWEFDAEGSGEIMFDKVVNGFLPGLFQRWKKMQVRHLISIVLFTRMEYSDKPTVQPASSTESQQPQGITDNVGSKDFYRVVVSDMASIESANILDRLKKEFLVFLRDVSIRRPEAGDYAPLGSGLSAASAELPDQVIAGQPSAASRGNVLEAINLASSQFSSDYIDRDLVRTGVSIVLISPGTGVFEVDYTLLVTTTENLTDNGVGIDLVCLSRMPLHSVPLFRYIQPPEQTTDPGHIKSSEFSNTPTLSYSNTMSFGSLSPDASFLLSSPQNSHVKPSHWNYGIPHWIDVSYWIGGGKGSGASSSSKNKTNKTSTGLEPPKHKPFKSRVRMYELQMMGVMESAISDISIPLLSQPWQFDFSTNDKQSLQRSLWLKAPFAAGSPIGSISSRDEGSGVQTPKLSSSPLSTGATNSKDIYESFRWMDAYDDKVFRHPLRNKRPRSGPSRDKALRKSIKARGASGISSKSLTFTKSGSPDTSTHGSSLAVTDRTLGGILNRSELDSSSVPNTRKPGRRLDSAPRKISFGPRGLGVATPTAAVAIATTDVAIGRDIKGLKRRKASLASDAVSMARLAESDAKSQSSEAEFQEKISHTSEGSQEESIESEDSEQEASRPIPISNVSSTNTVKSRADKGADNYHLQEPHDRVAALKDVRYQTELEPGSEIHPTYGPKLPTLSPNTSMAPWLTILNPCNPSKSHVAPSCRLGRWQHIYPRPLKASQIKWKSLRCPAAIPLTTEDFPTADQLAEEYRESSYFMTLPEEMDVSEQPRSLANELLAFRLSRGFQIVVGDQVADATAIPLLGNFDVFDEKILMNPGSKVYLSRGGTIHCLTRVAYDRLEIKAYHRHTTARAIGLEDDAYVRYTPLIRSMLAETYEHQAISTAPQRGIFNWESIDAFIAGYERPQAERYVSSLRPWRARFVLIPVDAPANPRRTGRSKELTEEEKRLEGIMKLTQFWQKCRFVLPEERRFTRSSRFSEDANPLDVQYFTKNTSVVVLEEIDNATGGDAISSPLQLLPESELYQRPGLKLKVLAERLQSDKGVRIFDRRWHLKLHHHCLVGSELTTWLLENFRDVNARQDAVELGNELMRDGLFKHVERRHEFRDGHYFYQITDEYRAPRPESKGFFGWVKASVPPTPIKEVRTAGTATADKSYDVSDTMIAPDNEPPKSADSKQRSGVALGKSLIYNLVQSRPKASYREELMNLHYDRLHNPDNCYHIRIEWMNATPKLVQDAVNQWAIIVEAYGLRLVEVPIGEASSIASMHPFRAPYLVELAQDPPTKQLVNVVDARTSAVATQAGEKHFYQKAILVHFNFVLDFEAAAEFPPNVEVTYSWGKPDYRYSQYIHRSGLLIAQIRDDGHFLILANRLYNNRSSSTRRKTLEDDSDIRAERSPISQRGNPLRAGDGLTQRSSPRSSPSPSPVVRAVLDVPKTQTPTSRSPLSNASSSYATPHNSISSDSTITDPEKLTREFQEFCSNKEALAAFYAEQISQESTPNPSTPIVNINIRKTPSRSPHVSKDERNIPELTLPGSLTEKTGFGGHERLTTRSKRSEREEWSPNAEPSDGESITRDESPLGRSER